MRMDRDRRAAEGTETASGSNPRVIASVSGAPVALVFHPHTEALMVATSGDGGASRAWHMDAVMKSVPGWTREIRSPGLTSLERLRTPMWPGWQNGLVATFAQGASVAFIKVDTRGRPTQSATVLQQQGFGFNAVAQGPDGIHVITVGMKGGDEVWRLLAR